MYRFKNSFLIVGLNTANHWEKMKYDEKSEIGTRRVDIKKGVNQTISGKT